MVEFILLGSFFLILVVLIGMIVNSIQASSDKDAE